MTEFTFCPLPDEDSLIDVLCVGDSSPMVFVDSSDSLDVTNSIAITLHLLAYGNGTILSFGAESGVGLRMQDDGAGGLTLVFETVSRDDDSVHAAVEFTNFPMGESAYVVAMYDGPTGLQSLSVNFVAGTTYSHDPPIQLKTNEDLYIGDASEDILDGSIYCVQIFDRVLTSDEITEKEVCPIGEYSFGLIIE